MSSSLAPPPDTPRADPPLALGITWLRAPERVDGATLTRRSSRTYQRHAEADGRSARAPDSAITVIVDVSRRLRLLTARNRPDDAALSNCGVSRLIASCSVPGGQREVAEYLRGRSTAVLERRVGPASGGLDWPGNVLRCGLARRGVDHSLATRTCGRHDRNFGMPRGRPPRMGPAPGRAGGASGVDQRWIAALMLVTAVGMSAYILPRCPRGLRCPILMRPDHSSS
jgi:hypothetical protein